MAQKIIELIFVLIMGPHAHTTGVLETDCVLRFIIWREYRIVVASEFNQPVALSCSSRWSAPRRALIRSWFNAARNFRAVREPEERSVSHGLRSSSRMTPSLGIEHVAVRASPLMRLT